MPPHTCILGEPQTKGDKMRSGYLTPAFSGAQKRAEMLPHPCILGDPETKGDKIRSGYHARSFLRAQKRAEMLHHPCILGDSRTKGDKIKSGYLSLAFSRAQKRAEVLHDLCILGDPHIKGDKIRSGYLRPTFLWPKRGRKCYLTPVYLGIPKQRGATSPLHCQASPNKGGENHNWLPRPCLVWVQQRAKMLHRPCIVTDRQTKGDKIRSGYLTPAFSGAQKR